MRIHRSSQSNVSAFLDFWNSAISYQRTKNLPLWPPYPEAMISEEIDSGLHFSAYFADGDLAGYFSVALSDALIWEEEQGNAIYIHRMCVNPNRRGSNLASSVLVWAYQHAFSLGRNFVRMDTWGDNKRLVDYYVKSGFRYIGDRRLGVVLDLPPHYSNTNLALFENLVPQSR
jgi:GNAT superfamily N-acetyltransferase